MEYISRRCGACGQLGIAPAEEVRRADGLRWFRCVCGHVEVEAYPGEWPVVTEGEMEAVRDASD